MNNMPKPNSILSYFSKTPKSGSSESKTKDVLTPRVNKKSPNGKSSLTAEKNQSLDLAPGDLVWSKLDGYPWWPSLVCQHPTVQKHTKKGFVHVQFFDDPVSRSWVKNRNVNTYKGSKCVEFNRGGIYHSTDPKCYEGVKKADEAMTQTRDERLELVVELLPSSEDEEMKEIAKIDFNSDIFDDDLDDLDNTKENSENMPASTPSTNTPSKRRNKQKRRRIIESGDEQESEDEYKPEKTGAQSESSDDGSGDEEHSNMEISSEDSDADTNVSRKRKRPTSSIKKSSSTPRIQRGAVDEDSEMTPNKSKTEQKMATLFCSTPRADKSDSSVTPSRLSSTPSISGTTKSKLANFAANDSFSSSQPKDDDEKKKFPHLEYEFLKPEKIRDLDRRRPDEPDYNPRTVFVPESFLNSRTPAQRQWWVLKSKHFDTVLFFKMGKFYELFNMDAVIGAEELGILYARGDIAHAGFPELSYSRYANILIQNGHTVARIEQVETPAQADERCKKMSRSTKFDKVVNREVCRISSKGTKVCSFIDGDTVEAHNNYLMAICEKESLDAVNTSVTYGVCFVDTSIGKFHIGQFTDDRHCSRLRTLISHYTPVQILYERGHITEGTQTVFNSCLVNALKESLRPKAEFWESDRTLKTLRDADYFRPELKKVSDEQSGECVWPDAFQVMLSEDDPLRNTATDEYDLGVRSLGAITWFLQKCFADSELLSLKQFAIYHPVDSNTGRDIEKSTEEIPAWITGNSRMILDGMTLANLDIFVNSGTGTTEGTLLERLDQCHTPFGKRLLKQWLCSPLCNPAAINSRLDAIEDLMSAQDVVVEVNEMLKKLPDLERQLSKIHTLGSANRNKNHPDSRAVFFEDTLYSKRKIEDFLSALGGFKTAVAIVEKFRNCDLKSKLLKQTVSLESQNGHFPDLTEELEFFDNGFDHKKAKEKSVITPNPGMDLDYDNAMSDLKETTSSLQSYLEKHRKKYGCKNINYFGTAKNRFQLEIPDSVAKSLGNNYDLTSQKKGYKRYQTEEIREMFADLTDAEERRDAAQKDTMRRIFASFDQQFPDNFSYTKWHTCVQCLCVLDVLICLADFSRTGFGEMCRPDLVMPNNDVKPFLEIREGRHPCIGRIFGGGDFIPNDTVIGVKDEQSDDNDSTVDSSRLALVTGPNMGGKSTLLRQVASITILAQLGCYVPAEVCRLTPIDRVFTRLGASDNIMAGESTFFVELSETTSILQHATSHSLVLMDELGRGTATYDGTAIACAVLDELSRNISCRTLFSTHYHSLVEQFSHDPNIRLGHMACMVENEGTDSSEETITFLYKFVSGACPKSYGFNAARLANIPEEIITVAIAKSKEFEAQLVGCQAFRDICTNNWTSDKLQMMLDSVPTVNSDMDTS